MFNAIVTVGVGAYETCGLFDKNITSIVRTHQERTSQQLKRQAYKSQ